jgi:hypothetical protein
MTNNQGPITKAGASSSAEEQKLGGLREHGGDEIKKGVSCYWLEVFTSTLRRMTSWPSSRE